jgi:RNA polymerase sigma factor (sigma-70 family)
MSAQTQTVDERLGALRARKIEYVGDDEFRGATLKQIEDATRQDGLEICPDIKPQAGVPAYLGELYAFPRLTPSGERAYFRQMNFLKYRAAVLRAGLFKSAAREFTTRAIDRIESLLEQADQVRNRIAERNLRLVVSIARRFATGQAHFDELVSEGNEVLFRAIACFDVSRGFRFSTYATHAIQRHFYRVFRQGKRRRAVEMVGSDESLLELPSPDRNAQIGRGAEQAMALELLDHMDEALDEREQYILRERFGCGPSGSPRTLQSLSNDLGICKERVRQLHHKALKKLRRLAAEAGLEPVLA